MPINPLELSKDQLRRIMKQFKVDLHKAYELYVNGFSYMDGTEKRTVQPVTDKNTLDWAGYAYNQLKLGNEDKFESILDSAGWDENYPTSKSIMIGYMQRAHQLGTLESQKLIETLTEEIIKLKKGNG
jgi:hypothetical protein